MRPPLHAVVYAPAGRYKSTFAATFPKPMLVLAFDPLNKMGPYYRRGIAGPEVIGECDQAIVMVASKKNPDKTIVTLEGFYDDVILADGTLDPTAYLRFLSRMPSFYEEVREGLYATVVVDTLATMSIASRNLHEFKLHKGDKDGRLHYARAKNDIEQAICCRLVNVCRGINFLVLTHVDKDKDEIMGTMIGQPAAPGSLATQDGLPARFPELYYIRGTREKDKTINYVIQTKDDGRYNAFSGINAPDGCALDYNALWANYNAEESAT